VFVRIEALNTVSGVLRKDDEDKKTCLYIMNDIWDCEASPRNYGQDEQVVGAYCFVGVSKIS